VIFGRHSAAHSLSRQATVLTVGKDFSVKGRKAVFPSIPFPFDIGLPLTALLSVAAAQNDGLDPCSEGMAH
jgi:hypothetical protein